VGLANNLNKVNRPEDSLVRHLLDSGSLSNNNRVSLGDAFSLPHESGAAAQIFFTTIAGGMFGQTQQPGQAGGLFGQPAQPAQQSTGLFGGNTGGQTNAFGQSG
jgi:hypothetical protein